MIKNYCNKAKRILKKVLLNIKHSRKNKYNNKTTLKQLKQLLKTNI